MMVVVRVRVTDRVSIRVRVDMRQLSLCQTIRTVRVRVVVKVRVSWLRLRLGFTYVG